MALGSTLPLIELYQEYFLADKGGRYLGLTTLPSLEIWESQPPGTCTVLSRPVQVLSCLYLYPH